MRRGSRITSYNVCYTKLLRFGYVTEMFYGFQHLLGFIDLSIDFHNSGLCHHLSFRIAGFEKASRFGQFRIEHFQTFEYQIFRRPGIIQIEI